jgi:hypothetical protein
MGEQEFRAAIGRGNEDSRTAGDDRPGRTEERQQLWWYLLALMAVILIGEGFVAARAA